MSERRLFVSWSAADRRAIWLVARLVHRLEADGDQYEFRYIRGALEAAQHGFRPFLAFPDLYRNYQSRELFPFFTNRVMPRTRPDYVEYVSEMGLDPREADAIAILERSGGKRETDRVEVVPAPVPDPSGVCVTHFLVRGIRYFPGSEERILRLSAGDRLLWMLDAQNDANPDAVALRTEDNYLLGYVPDHLVSDIAQLVERKNPVAVFVERVNPPPTPLHHRLLCRLEARWPPGTAPFQGERFSPLDAQEAPPRRAVAPA